MEANKASTYFAALDLGTNTFNLVIANDHLPFKLAFKTEKGVFLGKGGLKKQLIIEEASLRAQKVLKEYSNILTKYSIKKVRCVATEAIRNAKNSKDILKHLQIDLPISIEEIEGEQEAELIYKGVKSAGILNDENCIIMDIGGGSVEFIIACKDRILWKKSYKAGISRILESNPLSDPPSKEELSIHKSFFREKLDGIIQQIEKYKVRSLIGTAGSFDSWRKLLFTDMSNSPTQIIDSRELKFCIGNINSKTIVERKLLPGMEAMRVETIVPAGVLVEYLLDSVKFESITQCSYSLSEGVLWEMLAE
jgi:exopolyphosphatase/guanosine-5'-triphosphate,3'-diphosphate pyrophosphatase